MNFLENIFGELGISQYLGAFIDQGFDSWETILDITESDLDALGVKLGHRRVSAVHFPLVDLSCCSDATKKLQRRIANYRGVAPDASLVSPTRTSIEDVRHDLNRVDVERAEAKVGVTVTKRKYRRHPKPDEHAPERPPSAYVLFSNKMREDLKGQNLTFTEIAKLVGENWQNLGRAEKEPFEKQANEAKERYNRDLGEYKKTGDCRKYNEYLREFRKRQAVQTQGTHPRPLRFDPAQTNIRPEKDAAKRLKTDVESTRGSSTSGASIGPGGATSGSASRSESQHGSEPPPSRQQRLGSIASLSPGTSHMDDVVTSPIIAAQEDSNHFGRRRGMSSPNSHDAPIHSVHYRAGWGDGQCPPGDALASGVPWLDPRGAHPTISRSPEAAVMLGTHPGQRSRTHRISRGSTSSGSASMSQPPSLKHEQSSSYGSVSSSTPPQLPRTPSDASLPIHALLSSRPEPPASMYSQTPHPPNMNMHASQALPAVYPAQHSRIAGGYQGSLPPSNGIPGPRAGPIGTMHGLAPGGVASLPYERSLAPTKPASNGDGGLDGISALLRAREIVDRRP
ncbi:hypothetical protein F4802DRAFT_609535 [Xylaria palmicola]|nr:hypothetical protein F4802DRAFT_609535 [Xylaria palmicola]